MEILQDLSEADYHSQKDEALPLFTYSTAKTIVQKSAFHAHMGHPKLGNVSRPASSAMDKGSIIHGLLLGGGQKIAVIDATDFRTKDAQLQKLEAYSRNEIPILAGQMEEINTIVEIAKERISEIAPYFFDKHFSELSVKYEYNDTPSQSRWDWISPEAGKLIDLKTTNDANPEKLDRKIYDMGYDIQQAMYTEAANQAFPEMAGRFQWEYIFIETEAPYMVSVVTPGESFWYLGTSRATRAAVIWNNCLKSGKWPGYGHQVLDATPWMMNKEEMACE